MRDEMCCRIRRSGAKHIQESATASARVMGLDIFIDHFGRTAACSRRIRRVQTRGISLKSEMLFYGHAMVLRSYPAMTAGGWQAQQCRR
jgi:hypothetical protein